MTRNSIIYATHLFTSLAEDSLRNSTVIIKENGVYYSEESLFRWCPHSLHVGVDVF